MNVLRPHDRISGDQYGVQSIFLVGPTPRSPAVQSWRLEALQILTSMKMPELTVYVPEPFYGDYEHQIAWETKGLTYTRVIAAWIPRCMETMPALTTNIEFGEWLHNHKLVYGRPPSAPHCRYLDERYKYRDSTITGLNQQTKSPFGNVPHNTLFDLLVAAVKVACNV